MSLTIGRVGHSSPTLTDYRAWTTTGDVWEIEGLLEGSTATEVQALRQQLIGYDRNPDEPVIPVTSSVDTHLDGFYRVVGVQVAADPSGWAALSVPFRIQLQRVHGYAAPLFESTMLIAVRTNSHSITVANHLWSLPKVGTETEAYTLNEADDTRISDEGSALVWKITDTPPTEFTERFWVPPSSWYSMAATIENNYGDGTYRPVVGSQVPLSTTGWRLRNGLTRVVLTPSTTVMSLDVSHYDGAAWRDQTYRIGIGSSASGGTFYELTSLNVQAVAVLRNDPAEVVLRLAIAADEAQSSRREVWIIDISLRRGERNVQVQIRDPDTAGIARRYGVKVVNGGTGDTWDTGGMRRSVDDANGNQWVVLCHRGLSAVTSSPDPFVYITDLGSGDDQRRGTFGLSLDIDDSTETLDTSALLRLAYFGLVTEAVRVVER